MKVERIQDWRYISDQTEGYLKENPYRYLARKGAKARLFSKNARARRRAIPDISCLMRRERRILPRFLPRHGKLQFRSSADLIKSGGG